ncbi:hypothetical protein GTY23_31805 [Streptomyces sp. SID5998]|nr:hypothetical protein [Streptomyces sp. SID5998]
MTEERRETAWAFCLSVSSRLHELCTQDAALRGDITRLYRKWQVDPEGTDAKVRLLLTLALFSLVLDQPTSTTESDWERITTAAVLDAVVNRPVHELFASLPRLGLEEEGQVQALRLMSYSFGTSAGASPTVHYWAYLTTVISHYLDYVTATASVESPTCAALLGR